MIAVSINGFSKLARKKAKRYGIQLYDFATLSDEEIASWGGSATVEAIFVQFDVLAVVALVPPDHVSTLSQAPVLRYLNSNGYAAIMDAVRDDAAQHQGVQRYRTIDPAGYEVDGVKVTSLQIGYIGRLVSVSAECTAVQRVGDPSLAADLRSISIQRFDHSVPEVLRSVDEMSLMIDVSHLQVPNDSILHELQIRLPLSTTLKHYSLVGERRLESRATSVVLNVVTSSV